MSLCVRRTATHVAASKSSAAPALLQSWRWYLFGLCTGCQPLHGLPQNSQPQPDGLALPHPVHTCALPDSTALVHPLVQARARTSAQLQSEQCSHCCSGAADLLRRLDPLAQPIAAVPVRDVHELQAEQTGLSYAWELNKAQHGLEIRSGWPDCHAPQVQQKTWHVQSSSRCSGLSCCRLGSSLNTVRRSILQLLAWFCHNKHQLSTAGCLHALGLQQHQGPQPLQARLAAASPNKIAQCLLHLSTQQVTAVQPCPGS